MLRHKLIYFPKHLSNHIALYVPNGSTACLPLMLRKCFRLYKFSKKLVWMAIRASLVDPLNLATVKIILGNRKAILGYHVDGA
jgi:hypothetical protein